MEATIEQFLNTLLTALNDLTFVPYAVALITLLVSLCKRIAFLENVDAKIIHLFWQVVFWVGYAALTHFGKGEQLQQWTEAATIILQTLLPLIASLFGATWVYNKAVANKVAVIGYQRSAQKYDKAVG
jgi:hypothetical protein